MVLGLRCDPLCFCCGFAGEVAAAVRECGAGACKPGQGEPAGRAEEPDCYHQVRFHTRDSAREVGNISERCKLFGSGFRDLRGVCGGRRSSEYAAVKESFDEKYKRQQAVIQPLQPAALIAALEREAFQADKDSDQVYFPGRGSRSFHDIELFTLQVFVSTLLIHWERH